MSNRLIRKEAAKENGVLSHLYHFSTGFLDFFACVYLLMIIVVLPLYNKMSYQKIGTEKRSLLTGFLQYYWKAVLPFLAVYLILHMILMVRRHAGFPALLQEWKHSLSATDFFVLCYFLSVCVSWAASDYREAAFLGNAAWSMGALTQLSLAGAYFLISRLWKKKLWIVWLMVPVSGLLFILGFLNRFNLWPIPMAYHENPQFISLAGNINWYCGYLVTILFGGVFLAWSDTFSKVWQKRLIWGYLFIGFAALVTNGSSSGILTMLAIFFVLLLLSVSDKRKLELYCALALTLGLACLFTLVIRLLFPNAITYQETTNNLFTYSPLPFVLVLLSLGMLLWLHRMTTHGTYPVRLFRRLCAGLACFLGFLVVLYLLLLIINTVRPGSIGPLSGISAFTFSAEWGSRRGATWMAGFLAWLELPFCKKLVGVGPDCMGTYLYTDAGESLRTLLNTVWPGNTLSNAHCEWLTILVNLGILGLFSFAGMIISAVKSFLKKSMDPDFPFHSLVGACGLSVLAYSIHNIVSFQQVLNEPAMFVILAIGASYSPAAGISSAAKAYKIKK